MRGVPHRRQFDPVVHVGPEGVRAAVVDLAEEVSEVVRVLERLEGSVHRPERRIHEVLGALHLLPLQKRHVVVDRFVEPPVELLRRGDPLEFGERPVPVLLEPERGVRTDQLALEQRHQLLPRPGQQVDVAHQPGVVVRADSRGAGLAVSLGLEELPKVLRRSVSGPHRRIQLGAGAGDPLTEGGQIRGLVPEIAEAGQPEIPGVRSREVLLRLRQEAGDGPDPRRQFTGVGRGQRIVIGPKINEPVDHRPLVGGHIALGGEDRDVEARVPGPWPPNPVIEVEPVHLGTHQMPVDLLGDRPALGRERIQPGAPGGQLGVLAGHGLRAVVRDSVPELGRLEVPPLLEERDEVGVGARLSGRGRRRLGPATGERQADCQGEQRQRRRKRG